MTNIIETCIESIKRIDNWLNNPSSNSYNTERLMQLKSKYITLLDIELCHSDIKSFLSKTDKELQTLRDNAYDRYNK